MCQANLLGKSKHNLCSIYIFFLNCAVYRIIWKNTVESDRSWMKNRCARIACWVTKTTETDLEYVIVLRFPLQQWLHEGASTFTACIVSTCDTTSVFEQQRQSKLPNKERVFGPDICMK
jgi:hypothetical protein